MTEPKRGPHGIAVFTNVTTTVLLATLLALGVYVNINRIIVSSDDTNGYKTVNLDTTTWNVACTVVGTAVGILAAIAFANQDDCITRRELASDRGVVAIFLKPLTVKRGAEQLLCLQLPFERTFLIFLTIATALMSAAVVALFGIHASRELVINPSASYPLAGLNNTFFENDRHGALFPSGSPVRNPVTSQLSGFLYKAAYIMGQKMRGLYTPFEIYTSYIPEQGPLGDTIYGSLNTGGVGLNVSSYLQYSGLTTGFNLPAKYEFNKLTASVYGTHVNVSCQNVTLDYSVVNQNVDFVTILWVGKPNGPNLTLYNDLEGDKISTTLVIGSHVAIDNMTGDPLHTIVIPDFIAESAYVLDCTYSGREYLANVSVASTVSPLQIDSEITQGPFIGPFVKQQLANRTHDMLAVGGNGGVLARGFIDAEYNEDGENNTSIASALETVIGQLGEAYFSLLRQQVERSNIDKGGASPTYESELRLYVTVSRLGGAQYGWLAVLGLLLIGSIVGTVRTCLHGKAVAFEAQDAVKLLSTLHDASIKDKTRLRYDSGLVVLTEGEDRSREGQKS